MKKSINPFVRAVAVWLSLLLLLAATVACSFVPLGLGNSLVNGLVALIKAALVVVFFMHFRRGQPIVQLAMIIGMATLSLIFVLSGLDYITRSATHAPWQSTAPSLYVEPSPGR